LWSVIIIITAPAFMRALDCVHIVTTTIITIITTIIIDKKKGQPSSECPFKLLYCGSRGRARNAAGALRRRLKAAAARASSRSRC
jgi:hypothetical protein